MNERGFTLIELLVSMVILLSIITATLHFYEGYSYETTELGEYYSAKHLAVKGIELSRMEYIKEKNMALYQEIVNVNGVNFKTVVTKEEVTDKIDAINDKVSMIQLTAKTTWKNREVEVKTYVSDP